ncbi:UNVERIFIED_CONTAM: hypothetical protein GTU68_024950 [Idotea baltica]|nr:hypothetical protein [Idotea baltica]
MTDNTTAANPLTVAVPKETYPGEHRVAIVPATVKSLCKAGLQVHVESSAGVTAGLPDAQYAEAGATIVPSRKELFAAADIILQVRAAGANPTAGVSDLTLFRNGQTLIATCDPLAEAAAVQPLADKGVSTFALELLPRITRAQSMDILSSMATVAGYKAVLIAANSLPRMFPMMMTAAGTVKPARVLVVGAGVAGLQAISAAKRLGAVVFGYDIRPAVKEQVESLGGKFVELELETGTSEQSGGYAKEMGEDFYKKQRELMTKVVADCDAVITTAAIPGKTSPVLVTKDMVEAMSPGSVIVDLAAERGGNCEVTKADQVIHHQGVEIHGPTNLPATVPFHASEMFAKNISTFLLNLIEDKQLNVNLDDEIIRDTLVTRDGEIAASPVEDTTAADPKMEKTAGRPTKTETVMSASQVPNRGLATDVQPITETGSVGIDGSEKLLLMLTVFVLAVFVGVEIITKIPPTLHTPLMSGSNAISGITLIGALLATGSGQGAFASFLGFFAVVFATVNVVGGFLVTHRMLDMFRKKK